MLAQLTTHYNRDEQKKNISACTSNHEADGLQQKKTKLDFSPVGQEQDPETTVRTESQFKTGKCHDI